MKLTAAQLANPMLALARKEKHRPLKPIARNTGSPNDTVARIVAECPITDLDATAAKLLVPLSTVRSAIQRARTAKLIKSVGHHNTPHYVAV